MVLVRVLVVMVLVVMVLVVVSGAGTRKQIFQPDLTTLPSVLQYTWEDVSTTFDGPEVPPYALPFTVRQSVELPSVENATTDILLPTGAVMVQDCPSP